MQVRLEVAHQKANVKKVVLKQDATIGRSSECSLRIASSLVSRQHCKFTITDDTVMIRDLGSSNGTFVNGLRLEPQQDYEITPDSQLSVGGVMFVVRFTPPAPPPVVADPPGSTVDLPVVQQGRSLGGELTAEWSPEEVAAAGAVATAAKSSAAGTSKSKSAGAAKSKTPRTPAAKAPSQPPPGLAETSTFSGLPPAQPASVSPALANVAAVANTASLGDSAVEPIIPVKEVADAADVDTDSQTISATPEQIAAALASVGIAPVQAPHSPPRVDPLSEDQPPGDDDTLGDGTSPYYTADEEIGSNDAPAVDGAPVVVGIDTMARDAIPAAAGDVFDAVASSPVPSFDFESATSVPAAENFSPDEFAAAPSDTVDEPPEATPYEQGAAEPAEVEAYDGVEAFEGGEPYEAESPAAASPAAGDESVEQPPATQKKRGGLFSLFGLFGKKNKTPAKGASSSASPAIYGAVPDPLSEETPEFVEPAPVLPTRAEEAVADSVEPVPYSVEPVSDGPGAWASPVVSESPIVAAVEMDGVARVEAYPAEGYPAPAYAAPAYPVEEHPVAVPVAPAWAQPVEAGLVEVAAAVAADVSPAAAGASAPGEGVSSQVMSQAVSVPQAAEPAADDDGFNDFLKQIGQ